MKRQTGFTLIEILVVMAVISILMGFGIGMYQGLSSLGQATQARATVIETVEAVQRSSLGSRAENSPLGLMQCLRPRFAP